MLFDVLHNGFFYFDTASIHKKIWFLEPLPSLRFFSFSFHITDESDITFLLFKNTEHFNISIFSDRLWFYLLEHRILADFNEIF